MLKIIMNFVKKNTTNDTKPKIKYYLCGRTKKIVMKNYKNNSNKNLVVEEPMAVYAVADDSSIFTLIEKIKKGISFNAFSKLVKNTPFKISEWAGFLHISERTMQRYQKENKNFDALYTEKIYEVSMLTNYGVEVFGSIDNFNQWLSTSNVALGGIVPKTLLDSTFGIQVLKDELGRIEHGILA